MFDEGQAIRVRRDELFDSDRSDCGDGADEGADIEARARLNEQIAQSLGLILDETPTRKAAESKPCPDEGEKDGNGESADEFEFQLFSNSAPATKVVLEDDDVGDGALVRRRPRSYYLVTTLSEEQRLRYAASAVTGDEVVERAKVRSWGLELPWRVIHAESDGKLETPADKPGVSDAGNKGKGRPGKKKRMAMRTKAREAEEKARLAIAKVAEKEDHLKDKKKRLNRAKKLRRRAKAREQKAEAGGGADAGGSDDSE